MDPLCCGDRPIGLSARNKAASIARQAISLTDTLEGYANYAEYGRYLLPIKKAAGSLYAVATARGDLSQSTYAALVVLKRQIEDACTYLSDAFERDRAFEAAVRLLELQHEIDDSID